MARYVFDIETDDLDAKKIHCLVYQREDGTTRALTDYGQMRKFLLQADTLVGHNIQLFDIPVLEKLLGISIKARLIDTLALSWYLFPDRLRHGLESWGEDFGVPKPKIDDWENLAIEEYVHRCAEDVKINSKLLSKITHKMDLLYKENPQDKDRMYRYLEFKMDCIREQERNGWKVDIEMAKTELAKMEAERDEKVSALAEAMPKVPVHTKKGRPKKPYKQSGEPSTIGKAWFDLLKERNLPEDYNGTIEVINRYEEPNPASHVQVKDWLYTLGWKPTSFKYKRNKETGDVRKIEQIQSTDGDGVCRSVLALSYKSGGIASLDGLSILNHRIPLLRGFIENADENGCVKASIQGLTNTLRFKHRVVVNLPGIDKPYGEIIRGVLIAKPGMELCGADQSSLEDRCKQHYMWSYDPEYVKTQMEDGFDPHLDLALHAKAISKEQFDAYKAGTLNAKDLSELKATRKKFKAVNYASIYGAGAPTVARAAGVTTVEGEKLVTAYWKRNWSVKEVAASCKVKTCMGEKWLYNPVSRFWYSLRYEKDRFSTLCQGTGVFCFDTWLRNVKKRVRCAVGQMHDEGIWEIPEGDREFFSGVLNEAQKEANQQLGLNRELGIEIQFGQRYSEIH